MVPNSLDENEYNSDLKIEVSNNNTNMFSLHVAITLAAFLITNHVLKHVVKETKITSILLGHKWYLELIQANENKISEQLRMRKNVFKLLVCELINKYGLTPTKHIGVEENVVLFLYMIGNGASYRQVEEWVQHSHEIIHNHFYRVLTVIHKLGNNITR